MSLDKNKINNILEYILIFALFLIGIKKGGYYKEDSLIGIYLIQLISVIFFVVNRKGIKRNCTTSLLLLIFSIEYFISAFFNAASLSTALNVATRLFSLYLIFSIVVNSENKEKYIKAIVIFTILFCLLGVDELGNRVLDKPLEYIGSGYSDENSGQMSSIIQYANVLGILCVISIFYILNNLMINETESKVYSTILNTIINFLTISMLLTQSKMVLLLYFIGFIYLCIVNKKIKSILPFIFNTVYAFVITLIINSSNIYLTVIVSQLIFFVLSYICDLEKVKKYKNWIYTILLVVIIISISMNYSILKDNKLIIRIEQYFENFDSTQLRFTYYKDAFKIITSSPINFLFGVGGNGFRTMYETVQTSSYISLEVHSFFIQVFLESGLIGFLLILASIIYTLIKSKNNVYRVMLIAIIIFATFDVYLTYTYMIAVLSILLALCIFKDNVKETKISIFEYVVFAFVFIMTTLEVFAYIIEPVNIDDLNVTLEEQEKIINRCEFALKLSPYDINYLGNNMIACRNYLDIMDIKKELYNEDNVDKRKEIVSKIRNSVETELSCEKYNKYAIEDYVHYTLKYLDYMVQLDYSYDLKNGYEVYCKKITENLQKLKTQHSYNELAIQIYNEYSEKTYNKFYEVNLILNSRNIENILQAIK